MPSCFYLHPVLESEADVLPVVHRGVLHKAVPIVLVKFRDRAVQFFQSGTNLPIFSRFACRSVMAWLTSESRSFARLNRPASPSYFFWYSVWSRATRAFSATHCPISSATTFISSCSRKHSDSSSAVPKSVSFMES